MALHRQSQHSLSSAPWFRSRIWVDWCKAIAEILTKLAEGKVGNNVRQKEYFLSPTSLAGKIHLCIEWKYNYLVSSRLPSLLWIWFTRSVECWHIHWMGALIFLSPRRRLNAAKSLLQTSYCRRSTRLPRTSFKIAPLLPIPMVTMTSRSKKPKNITAGKELPNGVL